MARSKKMKGTIHQSDLLNESSSFQIAEAYKNLRTNLLFALSTSDNHLVAISSPDPNAGKTYTTANVAVTMAQTGSKVLIIDADMRKPKLHKIFHVDNELGLSNVLSGGVNELRTAVHQNAAPNVDLISSGPIPPNPSELLGHSRMTTLLSAVEKPYHYIFIDTPPVNVVSDALLVVKHTAGVLLITRQRQTTFDDVQRAIDKFRTFDAPILGLVVTDTESGIRGYGRYSGYDYEYK